LWLGKIAVQFGLLGWIALFPMMAIKLKTRAK